MRTQYQMSRSKFAIHIALAFIAPFASSQTHPRHSLPLDKHGTCATVVLSTLGTAFVIDSRVTEMQGNKILRQYTGCKALLARPTILLAGVGLVDTTGDSGRWNSLDAASQALASLPKFFTPEQIDAWGLRWQQTLIDHFEKAQQFPQNTGVVSEVLLITSIDGNPWFERVTVSWNGKAWSRSILGGPPDGEFDMQYSGACRSFVVHHDDQGRRLLPVWPSTLSEQTQLEYWATRRNNAKSISDLADAVYGFESLLTAKDERIEGEKAVIGRPFALAEWAVGAKGWTTSFNAECDQTAKQKSAPEVHNEQKHD